MSPRHLSTIPRGYGTRGLVTRVPRSLRTAARYSGLRSAPTDLLSSQHRWRTSLGCGMQTRGTLRATLSGHQGPINDAAFSADGSRVVTASDDNTARVWDAKTGALVAKLSGHLDRLVSARFSSDGSSIVTASFDRTARLWDARTGAARATLSGHTDWVNSAAFSPDGSRVVTASFDHSAKVWDARTGTVLTTLSGHGDRVISAAFSAGWCSHRHLIRR